MSGVMAMPVAASVRTVPVQPVAYNAASIAPAASRWEGGMILLALFDPVYSVFACLCYSVESYQERLKG